MTEPGPVQLDLERLWAAASWEPADWARLHLYQRKLDIQHRLVQAYDAELRKATSTQPLPAAAAATLVNICLRAAQARPGSDAADRAHRLAWLNSACRACDSLAELGSENAAPYRARLEALLAQEWPCP